MGFKTAWVMEEKWKVRQSVLSLSCDKTPTILALLLAPMLGQSVVFCSGRSSDPPISLPGLFFFMYPSTFRKRLELH